jgi:hypothetical protein
LPSKVIYEIYKKYPGWQIVNEIFIFSKEGDILKNSIKSKKGKTSRKLTVHPDGEIIAER